MIKRWTVAVSIFLLFVTFISLQARPVLAGPLDQIPTGSISTVTSTPYGPVVTVRLDLEQPSVNVRSGPSTTYEKVGVLLLGQKAIAKGRSAGGEWILIEYPGAPGGTAWVFGLNVNVTAGELKVIQPPPTPTPLYTVTIDPTMAAQFVVTLAPTRIASFTPPPPLVIPTFTVQSASDIQSRVPMGLIIIGLAAVGIFLGIFSFSQGR
jgi:hypothetical protein